MKIVFIGDQDTVTAFRLAGVKQIYNADEGRQNLKQIFADDGTGVVIMTERFAEENRRAVDEHKSSKRITPIVVEVPDMAGPLEREVDPISELIRRAIGAEVQ